MRFVRSSVVHVSTGNLAVKQCSHPCVSLRVLVALGGIDAEVECVPEPLVIHVRVDPGRLESVPTHTAHRAGIVRTKFLRVDNVASKHCPVVVPSDVGVGKSFAVRIEPVLNFAVVDLVDGLDVPVLGFVLRILGPRGEEIGFHETVLTNTYTGVVVS